MMPDPRSEATTRRLSTLHEPVPVLLQARLTWRINDIEAATGLSRRTLERLRSAGKLPRPDRTIGRMPLWFPETIRRWIEEGDRA